MGTIEFGAVKTRATELISNQKWAALLAELEATYFDPEFDELDPSARLFCLQWIGRSHIYLEAYEKAIEMLGEAVQIDAADDDALFYLARAYELAGYHDQAINSYQIYAATASRIRPAVYESLAAQLHFKENEGFGSLGHLTKQERLRVAHAIDRALAKGLKETKAKDKAALYRTGVRIGLDRQDTELVKRIAEEMVANEELPANRKNNTLTYLIRTAYKMGLYDLLIELKPILKDARTARSVYRDIESRIDRKPPEGHFVFAELARSFLSKPELSFRELLAQRTVYSDYVIIAARPLQVDEKNHIKSLISHIHRHSAGFCLTNPSTISTASILVIRSDVFAQSVIANKDKETFNLVQLAEILIKRLRLHKSRALFDREALHESVPQPKKTILLLSRSGHVIRGGGERFLRGCADYYAKLGHRVLLAGTGNTDQIQYVEQDEVAHQCVLLPSNPTLARHAIEHIMPDVIHTMSGFADYVLETTKYLNIKIMYGVHHWRDLLAQPTSLEGFFSTIGRANQVKVDPDFADLIDAADVIYTNSDFSREVVQFGFGISTPVIPSCCSDIEPEEMAGNPNGHILLINPRPDKGWLLFLEIAKMMPNRKFVAYANQGKLSKVHMDIAKSGATNVEVRTPTQDARELYRDAAIVLTPSFDFIETYGRIPIEAGWFGIPCLMASSGNLSAFGEIGVDVLDGDPKQWAQNINQMLVDQNEYQAAAARSLARAQRWSQNLFENCLGAALDSLDKTRVLLVAGAGLGNVLHVTPLIKKLSRHFGQKIDVHLLSDHARMLGLIRNPEFTRYVYNNNEWVNGKNYDRIYVTNSVSPPLRHFLAPQVYYSRDYLTFDPSDSIHEAEINLQFLRLTDQVPYTLEEVSDYFIGTYERNPVGRNRIILHGGSKGGVWATKRWPYFTELAEALVSLGMEVYSVGIPPEYVEGTLDATDMTFDEMTEFIASADLVVSNDSGIMNVANALEVPTVAIFGPTNPVTRGPLNTELRLLTPDTDCSPCERTNQDKLVDGACSCIRLVSLPGVIQAAQQLLANTGPVAKIPEPEVRPENVIPISQNLGVA